MSIEPIQLPGKYTNERVVVTCDYAKRLGQFVSLDENSAQVTAEVITGEDGNPSAILSGLPSVSGSRVMQFVIGGVSGVTYKLIFQVDTSEDTPQRLIEELDITVEDP